MKGIGSIEDNATWQEVEESGSQFAEVSQETEYTKKLEGGFGFFGVTAFVFACFYAFCMFRNPSGVTYPFFVAGGLWFFGSALRKLGISWKKGSGFYMAAMMLLAISTFCTDDGRIIWMNKAGILVLFISLLLGQLYDTSGWKLGKYVGSIFIMIFASLGELDRPFKDAFRFQKEYRKSHEGGAGEGYGENRGGTGGKNQGEGLGGKLIYVVMGIGVVIPVFYVVFLLLFRADAVFREMSLKLLFTDLDATDFWQICLMIVFMFLAVYCLLSYFCKKSISEKVAGHHTGEPVLAITVTGPLTMMYLAFSVIQIVYLFLGQMQLPEGYTYAEYAREGFFELLAVSVLNLIIVLACMEYFRESRVLKGILTVMSLCTFIMILSSGLRMIIYIRYYYLTFLRIFVLWSLVVLFLLFIGVAAGIFRKKFPLFRYSCVVVTCCYLVLSFGHPDYWIAKVNLSMAGVEAESDSFFLGEGFQDYAFLSGLSADAAPALLPHLEEQGGNRYLMRMQEKDLERFRTDIRQFNVSRFIALQNLEKYFGTEEFR